jgi:hypothetical protein
MALKYVRGLTCVVDSISLESLYLAANYKDIVGLLKTRQEVFKIIRNQFASYDGQLNPA